MKRSLFLFWFIQRTIFFLLLLVLFIRLTCRDTSFLIYLFYFSFSFYRHAVVFDFLVVRFFRRVSIEDLRVLISVYMYVREHVFLPLVCDDDSITGIGIVFNWLRNIYLTCIFFSERQFNSRLIHNLNTLYFCLVLFFNVVNMHI